MKALILAAGYAVRLYPLTKNFPKPLLKINNKPIISYIVERLEELKEISTIYIVTNQRYFHHFESWKNQANTKIPIEIINDQTETEETKLGGIGDIVFTIKNKNTNDDLLIIAGDNIFDFSLQPMMRYFQQHKKDTISLVEKDNIEELKRGGIVTLDKNNKIIKFIEKPKHPPTNLYSNCLYIFTKDTVRLYQIYLEQGNNPDQPGRFVQWLYTRKEVHGFVNKGRIFDIGTHESLKRARKEFK